MICDGVAVLDSESAKTNPNPKTRLKEGGRDLASTFSFSSTISTSTSTSDSKLSPRPSPPPPSAQQTPSQHPSQHPQHQHHTTPKRHAGAQQGVDLASPGLLISFWFELEGQRVPFLYPCGSGALVSSNIAPLRKIPRRKGRRKRKEDKVLLNQVYPHLNQRPSRRPPRAHARESPHTDV
ncbi:hypothetical protein BDQ17DRAFT_818140 [Cyathus striatus]|nr:hypothetical protein BDQ17DRAFT_818140 [Cyathus striatus]